MNRYFSYENIQYWDAGLWKDKISAVYPLVTFMGDHEPRLSAPYDAPLPGDPRSLPCYDVKTNCVSVPEVVEYWKSRGVHYERRAQGGVCWLIMCPEKSLRDFGTKLKTLVVIHNEDITDPYWAMKVLQKYRAYNKAVADGQDLCVFYICTGKTDYDRVYVNILQEAFVFAPGDTGDVWLDLSPLYDAGYSLKDVPGLKLKDPETVSLTGAGIPALNITGRWENRVSLSRDQLSMENWSSEGYELDRLVHSESGRRLAEGMAIEYEFDTTYDPAFIDYWKRRGMTYVNHVTANRRWKMAIPTQALETGEKLPVLIVMQEVNHANEHLAVTETSYFLEYYRIAAQGECMLLSFVLEDANDNELLCRILEEAQKSYHNMDMSRVYIAGHSHNGHYALEFATRHPDLIAAVATFGDAPGLQNSGITPMTPQRAEEAAKHDIPTIVLAGMKEFSVLYPLNRDGEGYRPGKKSGMVSFESRVAGYQLRLQVSGCPMKTAEEIAATADSPETAVRMLGIPGDRSEVIWADGAELYIVDVKNNAGKYHLRFVGEENMPHNTTPMQQNLSWSFLRRFARDAETGAVIERY